MKWIINAEMKVDQPGLWFDSEWLPRTVHYERELNVSFTLVNSYGQTCYGCGVVFTDHPRDFTPQEYLRNMHKRDGSHYYNGAATWLASPDEGFDYLRDAMSVEVEFTEAAKEIFRYLNMPLKIEAPIPNYKPGR